MVSDPDELRALAEKMGAAMNAHYDENGPWLPGVEFFAQVAIDHYAKTPVPSGPWVLREDLEPALFGECHPCYFQEQEDWRDAVVATLDALTHGRSDG